MNVILQPELAEQVLALTNEFGYTPAEIVSIGIALSRVLFRERTLGNEVVVLNSEGRRVAEFVEAEPQVLQETVRNYVESICPDMEGAPAALLVAKLEQERDVEAGRAF
jgi:hypothetical protein